MPVAGGRTVALVNVNFDPRITAHQLIRDQPPPTPKCFDSRESWQSFLISASASGERVIRRTDVGKHTANRRTGYAFVLPIVAHCLDCPREYRERMQRAGRCQAAINLDLLPIDGSAEVPPSEHQPPGAPRMSHGEIPGAGC